MEILFPRLDFCPAGHFLFDRFTRRWKAVNQPLLIGLVLQSTAVSGSGPSVGENPYIAKILRIPDEKSSIRLGV
jgi:hypothetical protein